MKMDLELIKTIKVPKSIIKGEVKRETLPVKCSLSSAIFLTASLKTHKAMILKSLNLLSSSGKS